MPVSIILDTDMDTDCDDVGAMAVLHALASNHEANILGVICDAPTPWAAPCVDAINTYYDRPEIPIGVLQVDDPETDARYALYRQHVRRMEQGRVYLPYNEFIGRNFPRGNRKRDGYGDGVTLYRKLLSEQPDNSVVITAVGLLTVLESLLNSAPDEYSPLDGRSLVRTKVRMLVTMGGGSFPTGRDTFNWWMDRRAAASVLNDWPTALAVSEWGEKIQTGARLLETPEASPVRRAYELYLLGPGKSRSSWDQVAVLYSVRGLRDYFTEIRGYRIRLSPDTGEHHWSPDETGEGRQVYLQQAVSDERLAETVEELMTELPTKRENEDGSDARAD